MKWLALLWLCLLPSTAWAQWLDEVEEAKRAYARGVGEYEGQRYDQALAQFRRALELSNRAALNFNIARCLEKVGRFAEAAEALRRYLAKSRDVPDREALEREADDLEARARAVSVQPSPRPALAPPAGGAPSRLRPAVIGSWVATGALALVAAGLTVGAAASYQQLALDCPERRAACSASALDQLRALDRSADALWAVGAAAAITSTVLTVLWHRRDVRARSFAGAGGMSAALEWNF